jgi:hypothetical protein
MMDRDSNYEYSNCRIIVVKLKDKGNIHGEYHYIKGKQGRKIRDTYVNCGNLSKGEYLIFV